jgi:hypothetical protein
MLEGVERVASGGVQLERRANYVRPLGIELDGRR